MSRSKPNFESKCYLSRTIILKAGQPLENELPRLILETLDDRKTESKHYLELYQDSIQLKKSGLFNFNTKTTIIKNIDIVKYYLNATSSRDLIIFATKPKDSYELVGVRFKSELELDSFTSELTKMIKATYSILAMEERSESVGDHVKRRNSQTASVGLGPRYMQANNIDEDFIDVEDMMHQKESRSHIRYDTPPNKSLVKDYLAEDKNEVYRNRGESMSRPPLTYNNYRSISGDGTESPTEDQLTNISHLNPSVAYSTEKGYTGKSYGGNMVKYVTDHDNDSNNSTLKSKPKWMSDSPEPSNVSYRPPSERKITPVPMKTQPEPLRVFDDEPATPPITSITSKDYFKFKCGLSKFNTREFLNFPSRTPKNVNLALAGQDNQYKGVGMCFYETLTFSRGLRSLWRADVGEIEEMKVVTEFPNKILLRKNDKTEKKSQYVVLALQDAEDVEKVTSWFKDHGGNTDLGSVNEIVTVTPDISEGSITVNEQTTRSANKLENLSLKPPIVTESFKPSKVQGDSYGNRYSTPLINYPTKSELPKKRELFEKPGYQAPRGVYNFVDESLTTSSELSTLRNLRGPKMEQKTHYSTQYFNDDLWEVDEALVKKTTEKQASTDDSAASVYLWVGHTKYPYY